MTLYKWVLCFIVITIIVLFAYPRLTAHADSVEVSTSSWVVKPSIQALISHYSEVYGISSSTLTRLLNCESRLNPDAVGDHGTSYGAAQIHLPAHPDVTEAEALDPDFAINWTAQKISTGQIRIWSCARILGLY